MKRWHDETALMFARWKLEMRLHGYDWRCPPTDPKACHCVTGIGFFRKKRVARRCNCSWCNPGRWYRRRSSQRRAAIRYELEGGDI